MSAATEENPEPDRTPDPVYLSREGLPLTLLAEGKVTATMGVYRHQFVCTPVEGAEVPAALPADAQQPAINAMLAQLEAEDVAYDIGNYRAAPPGFRIWGGATIEAADLQALTPWLDYVFAEYKKSLTEK